MKNKMDLRIIVLLAFVITIIVVLLASATPSHNFKSVKYIVDPGDCLWEIASRFCPSDMSKWDYIEMLCTENNLDSCTIYPGQLLTVFKVVTE